MSVDEGRNAVFRLGRGGTLRPPRDNLSETLFTAVRVGPFQ